MQRLGFVIGIRPESIDEYKKIHVETWPEILDLISRTNIRNYSIFLKEPENLLFAYMEYVGDDLAADMQRQADDDAMQRWWDLCKPMQEPLATRQPDEWWAAMEPVFFTDG